VTRRGVVVGLGFSAAQHEPTWPPWLVETREVRSEEPRSRYSADARSNGKSYVTHLGPSLSSDPIAPLRGRVGESAWQLASWPRMVLDHRLSHWAEDI
jgi:hypothetical protein